MRLERAADEWTNDLDALLDRIGPRFGRAEPRQRARVFVRGVLSGLRRKNGWTLAHFAGDDDPNGMQRLLNAARWDVDGVRDDLRDWVVERLVEPYPGVLVAHEAAFPKKGNRSVGVHRRYNSRSGRVENVQVGLFLTFAGRRAGGLLDRELYLPRGWTDDPERCQRAGVPDTVRHTTRPELVRRMVERALDAGVPAPWVACDEPYGEAGPLRAWLDSHDVGYALAVPGDERVTIAGGTVVEVRELARALPSRVWDRRSYDGRVHDWARVALAGSGPVRGHEWRNCLLLRRSIVEPDRVVYHRCRVPAGTQVAELIRVARTPSTVEARFQQVRRALGLDQYQVRRYDAWYRHVTLCLVAGAYQSVSAAQTVPDRRMAV